jgi:hypothetical protein
MQHDIEPRMPTPWYADTEWDPYDDEGRRRRIERTDRFESPVPTKRLTRVFRLVKGERVAVSDNDLAAMRDERRDRTS